MTKSKKPCDCVICKHQHEFEFPDELVTDIYAGKVVLFAGSGISTESSTVMNETFYETIADELNINNHDISFPELMELYCQNTNGRIKLLECIKRRFNTIDSFPELKRSASRFHKELGSLYFIKDIITTNWDTYFEEYCKATPFVNDSDLAFWEAAKRRVLKIHGSISNYGSLVASTKDYSECQARLESGLIGSILKGILATKTVIFIGYSLSDSDFIAIYDFVKAQMKSLYRQCYVVTPFKEEAKKLDNLGLFPIITDGTYFLSQIKIHAVNKGIMLPDNIFSDAVEFVNSVVMQHEIFHNLLSLADYPQMIYSASYQDGLIHALERAIEMRYSGEYSDECSLKHVILTYNDIQDKLLAHNNYLDYAYIEGYINGLYYLLMDDKTQARECIPICYNMSKREGNPDLHEYIKDLKANPDKDSDSTKLAERYIREKISEPSEVVFHHPPWI